MTWQPIETAPRDGTPLLLQAPDGRLGIGYMRPETHDDVPIFNQSAAWIGPDRFNYGKTSVSLGGYAPDEALYWHPLPDAAKE